MSSSFATKLGEVELPGDICQRLGKSNSSSGEIEHQYSRNPLTWYLTRSSIVLSQTERCWVLAVASNVFIGIDADK